MLHVEMLYEFQNNKKDVTCCWTGVTVVDEEWLPEFAPNYCTFSKPLEQPPPAYDVTSDCVTCHRSCTYGSSSLTFVRTNCISYWCKQRYYIHRLTELFPGAHSWLIPATELPYPVGVDQIRHFARFFLEGEVFPKLKDFTPLLLSRPVTMVKSWAKYETLTSRLSSTLTYWKRVVIVFRLQPRTESLLNALMSKKVTSRKTLQHIWSTDSQCKRFQILYKKASWCC